MHSKTPPRNRLAKVLPEEWRKFLVDNGVPKRKYTAVLRAAIKASSQEPSTTPTSSTPSSSARTRAWLAPMDPRPMTAARRGAVTIGAYPCNGDSACTAAQASIHVAGR